jgi:hypothetical protein
MGMHNLYYAAGWAITTLLAPAHHGITRNEKVDECAKNGTADNPSKCSFTFTSKAWHKALSKRILAEDWQLSHM